MQTPLFRVRNKRTKIKDKKVITAEDAKAGKKEKKSDFITRYCYTEEERQNAIKELGMSSVRLYATGVNLLTFTNYNGYDPEARRDDTGIGEEFYSTPPARTIALGVNINF